MPKEPLSKGAAGPFHHSPPTMELLFTAANHLAVLYHHLGDRSHEIAPCLDYQQFGSPQGTAFVNAQEIACTAAESFARSVAYHVKNGQGVLEELSFWRKAGMWKREVDLVNLFGDRDTVGGTGLYFFGSSVFVSSFMERVCCINFCNELANIFIHSWMSLCRFSFYGCMNISGSGELAFPFSCAFLKWVCQYSDTRKC